MQDTITNSPFIQQIKNMVGPIASKWAGTDAFKELMGKFGRTIDDTTIGKLIRFEPGMNAGDILKTTTDNIFNFLRNGGSAPTLNATVDLARMPLLDGKPPMMLINGKVPYKVGMTRDGVVPGVREHNEMAALINGD